MAIAEKWCGSHKEMFGFVRAVSRRSPRGQGAVLPGRGGVLRACAAEVTAALYAWLDAGPATLEETRLDLGGGVACYLCGAVREARFLVAALRGEIHVLPWAWIAEGPRERSEPGFMHDRILRSWRAAELSPWPGAPGAPDSARPAP